VVLGVRSAAVRWNSGELIAGLGRRNSGGGPRGHTDAIWGRRKAGAAPGASTAASSGGGRREPASGEAGARP
jgi:hypothetical protein